MPGPEDPAPRTSGWGWTGLPTTPWWRQGARVLGVDDDLDRAAAAVQQAGQWLNGILPAAPKFKPEFEERFAADQAAMDQRRTANTAAVGNFARRIMGSAPVQGLTETVASQFRPTDQTNQMIDMAKAAVTARSNAMRAPLGASQGGAAGPAWTGTEPLDRTLGFLGETLPNFALDVARDSSTPGGALSNLDLPVAQALPFLAKAGGALSHAALPPGFYSKVERIAEKIPAKGVAPNKLKAMLQGGGASAEELGHRKVNEFITQRLAEPNRPITQAEFAAHLGANPLPDVQFHTQGGPPAPLPPEKQAYDDFKAGLEDKYGDYFANEATSEEMTELEGLWKAYEEGPEPPETSPASYGPANYRDTLLPGGKHYGESLTSVAQPTAKQDRHRVWISKADHPLGDDSIVYTNEDVPATELARLQEKYQAPYTVHSEEIATPIGGAFTGGHYGHVPNVIGSARTTERFLPATVRPLHEIEAIIQQAIGAKSPTSIASGGPEMAVKKGLITADEAAAYGHSRNFTNYPQPPGRKGVFGEEFQGDLHREGRTHGYVKPPTPEQTARMAELRRQKEAIQRERFEADEAENRAADDYMRVFDEVTKRLIPPEFAHLEKEGNALTNPNSPYYRAWHTAREAAAQTPEVRAAFKASEAAYQASAETTKRSYGLIRPINTELNTLTKGADPNAVPDMPFKGDAWLDLELKKQLLRVAHDPDASWFGWSGGQTIADRYNLAKHVDKLHFEPEEPGNYTIGALVGFKDGREVIRKEGVTHEEFKKFLNKEQAQALSNQVRERGEAQAQERYRWSIDQTPEGRYQIVDPDGKPLQNPHNGLVRTFEDMDEAQDMLDAQLARELHDTTNYPQLTGQELQFGEKWPFQTYDETTRRKVEKILQPFGVPVEPLADVPGSGTPGGFRFRGPNGSSVGPEFDSPEAARAWRPGWEEQGYKIDQVVPPKPGEPGWITNFTPEQKRRMRDEGFSFMSMLPPAAVGGAAAAGAAAGAQGDPNDPNQQASSNLPFNLSDFAQVGLAGMPFLPGHRPYLNRSGQRAIEELRHVLGQETLRGPVSSEVLGRLLKEAPLGYAHRVSKGLPVPPALGSMNRILTPGDLGFNFAPKVTERIHQMAEVGEALPHQANWGGATDPAILPAFNNDRRAAGLFGSMFASASPRTSVPKNALENLNIWRSYLRDPGKPFTDDRLRSMGVGNARSKTDNINRAIAGFDPSGEKVDLFTDYMTGRAKFPVPDVHWLYGMGSEHGSIDSVLPEIRELAERHFDIPRERALDPKDYVHMLNDASANALQSWSPGQNMGPLFGQTWEGIRAQKGLPFQGGMIDLYEPHGLLQKGAMFDDKAISNAIMHWGGR